MFYLWRNIIPYLSEKACCIAPDLIGMGKSDQANLGDGFKDSYTYLEDNPHQIGFALADWYLRR